MTKKAVIFDMDGLMFDSERATYEEYVKICRDRGCQMTRAFYVTLLGRPLPAAIELLRKEYGPDFPASQVVNLVQKGLHRRFLEQDIPIKKGLPEILEALKKRGFSCIVASSSNRQWVEFLIKKAGVAEYFLDIICGDEIERGKPNPDIFLCACEKLGCSPEEAWVLEDSEAGIEAAHRAGIDCIGIPDMKEPSNDCRIWVYKMAESLLEAKEIICSHF